MLDQWTAKEVEEHLTAARVISEEQERAVGEIAIVCETHKVMHITLPHRLKQLIEDTEDLKRGLSCTAMAAYRVTNTDHRPIESIRSA